jgi:transcriptional regulator with GAF, ATPase, and Fis domain
MGVCTGAYVGAYERFEGRDRVSYERGVEQVIGNSPALETVLEEVGRVAPTDSSLSREKLAPARV